MSGENTATAQDFERYRPRTPGNTEGEYKGPKEPKKAKGNPRTLVDELKGLVFVDHPKKVTLGNLDATGVQIDSEDRLQLLRHPGFRRVVGPYLGQPVSLRRLNQMVREIILFYRQMDQPVVDVSIPEQDITDGVVQVVVNEGRIGNICVKECCHFHPEVLWRQTWLCSGQPIYESQLKRELHWLNRNPFRTVDLELTPGKKFGDTDVVFKVHDRLPLRVYGGYEDTGTLVTGLQRLVAGFNYGNAFGLDHQFGYQYTASTDFYQLETHSAVYSIPLFNRDKLFFYGSYGEFNSNLLTVSPLLDQSGTAWQVAGRYHYELCPICNYTHRLAFGVDFKQLNTDLDFGGISVFDEAVDVVQFVVGYHGGWVQECESFLWGADAFVSPGGLSSGNDDQRFMAFRHAATADYYYARAYLQRAMCLCSCAKLVVRATGQIAEDNLLPTEQLGLGGFHTIRGYDMRLLNGDSGYFVNVEVHSRPICLGLGNAFHGRCGCCHGCSDGEKAAKPACKPVCDELNFLVFFDQGEVYNHTLLPGEDRSIQLRSAGPGLRYKMGNHVFVRVGYGFQLQRAPFSPDRNSRWHVGAVVGY